MSKRHSKLAQSIKEIAEIEVIKWDFIGLLNSDIHDLEIANSLRKLGSIRVMEWDFRTVMPAVNKIANQEVDVVDVVKRIAQYKVMEWDFRKSYSDEKELTYTKSAKREKPRLSPAEMQVIIERLKNFLQYVAVNLINEPNHAQIKVAEIATNVLRFKLILVKRDVSMLIGKDGYTASAIRNIVKAIAKINGVHALLEIHSHEEEMEKNHPSFHGGA